MNPFSVNRSLHETFKNNSEYQQDLHFRNKKVIRSINPNCSVTKMILGNVSVSDALEFSGDPQSLNPELPVLHKLYENYTLAGKNMSRLLDAVFKNYDKRIRPFYEVKSLKVDMDLLILSFGELSETQMEFSVDLYMAQFWQDPRLGFDINQTIILSGDATDKLWVPDTFIINSIDTKIHKLVSINKKAWIHLQNGTIMLVLRFTARSSCKVDLRDYPLDDQICHLAFESFSFEEKDLNLTWRQPLGTDIFIYDKEMAQFDILTARRRGKHPTYHSEQFTGLTATVHFRRRTVYYIFQMYIPCICVVILSWVSFWVDETDGSDRVGLGIATVLTISFMQGALNDNVPRVSYLKSVDYFLLGSFVFVFMTLIEYVLVLKQSRKERKRKKEREKKTLERERKREAVLMMADSDDEKMTVTVSIGNKTYDFNKCKEKTEKTELLPCSNHSNSERAVRIMEPMGNVSDNCKPTDRSQLKKFQRRPSMIQMIRKTIEDGEEEICYLDKYSRIVFPVSYTIFLGIYFGIYTVRWDNLVSGANGK
ncbi:gamma-aminobutyric acid receptor subunit beta-2-like [Acropora palmata]|uniref:gamma-aminobutyric acid receptor subunit beta-2-like n=1 Tax=Acropora palmata TaxID=6131 RepID=UPI003DA09755